MNTSSLNYPRVPLKHMDPAMLVFELDRATQHLLPHESRLITSAATLASFLHRNQTRFVRNTMPRVPYIEHPLRVALRLLRWDITDPELIAAALLHDVVEDCAAELLEYFSGPEHAGETALECLQRLYGADVATLVEHVTNPADVVDAHSYLAHVRTLASSGSVALYLKASDLKDNAGSIRHQLGHGKDERMLRMVAKYRPAVAVVLDALEAKHEHYLGLFAIITDMRVLLRDLDDLAGSHNIPLQ
ncbi:hypothetical protein ANMWB30_24080 [Arthrobacter sp. MWB30]|nr:hypothetical protein ANMWB30_24080 [Arthrobacter sp. MWB30]